METSTILIYDEPNVIILVSLGLTFCLFLGNLAGTIIFAFKMRRNNEASIAFFVNNSILLVISLVLMGQYAVTLNGTHFAPVLISLFIGGMNFSGMVDFLYLSVRLLPSKFVSTTVYHCLSSAIFMTIGMLMSTLVASSTYFTTAVKFSSVETIIYFTFCGLLFLSSIILHCISNGDKYIPVPPIKRWLRNIREKLQKRINISILSFHAWNITLKSICLPFIFYWSHDQDYIHVASLFIFNIIVGGCYLTRKVATVAVYVEEKNVIKIGITDEDIEEWYQLQREIFRGAEKDVVRPAAVQDIPELQQRV